VENRGDSPESKKKSALKNRKRMPKDPILRKKKYHRAAIRTGEFRPDSETIRIFRGNAEGSDTLIPNR